MENNDNTILDVFQYQKTKSRTPQEELKSFKFANVMYF